MKKMIVLLSATILLTAVRCSKEDEVTPGKVSLPDELQSRTTSNTRYYAPWVYVMDARFSRETCATGPGVCFKNEFGDIWSYSFVDNSDDGDVGPIGVKLENELLHFSFFRSLEEDAFIIEEDVKISDSLAKALGKSMIILKAGEYAVSYDNYRFGEAYVEVASR